MRKLDQKDGKTIMDALIIYFSQTGGTEEVAKIIHSGIMSSGNNCELVRMKDKKARNLKSFDLIGIGCPTFFYRECRNISQFINEMNENGGKHCFIFCTHGSQIGNTFYYMSEGLKKKGYVVIGSYDSYADSSIQFYPKIMHTAHHPDNTELEEAKKFGVNICNLSLRIQKGGPDLLPQFELVEDTWWAKDSNLLTPEILRKISPKFTINVEKCTQCLTCQDNCPGNAINVEKDPPEIQNDGCISCWYCEKGCPEDAIEADWTGMREAARPNLKKYIEILKEAEREGKFRPHVDYEKIF